ncbi:MAG: hypothetical protein WHT06_05195 [Desulfobacterales bacterium]
MRYFSIRILACCILLPPVLYLGTVAGLEVFLAREIRRGVEENLLGDTRSLLEGSTRLQAAVQENVERYLGKSSWRRLGVDVRLSVRTTGGKKLYPSGFEEERPAAEGADPLRVAQENFRLLEEGLEVSVQARLEHNRLLSNAMLAVYVGLALAVLFFHYRRAALRSRSEEEERRRETERLTALQAETSARLSAVEREREALSAETRALEERVKTERLRAERNEDDFIREIEELERKLAEHLERQSKQQQEIESLKETLAGLDRGQRREEKARIKAEEAIRRRLSTLYKNLTVNERAVQGMAELTEELRLKAEEVIHQLNAAPELVTVKRKVFGKKNRETVLEVVFGYKGRLYFRRGPDRRVEVLAVGTKNTQERELEFLASL